MTLGLLLVCLLHAPGWCWVIFLSLARCFVFLFLCKTVGAGCPCKRSASARPADSKLAAKRAVAASDEERRRSGACPTSAVSVVVKSLASGAADTQDGLLQPCFRPHNSTLPALAPHSLGCIFARPSHLLCFTVPHALSRVPVNHTPLAVVGR